MINLKKNDCLKSIYLILQNLKTNINAFPFFMLIHQSKSS